MDMRKGIMAVVLSCGIMGMNGFAFSAESAMRAEPASKRPILSRLLRVHSYARELNLASGQKEQIRDILAKHRDQLLRAVRNRLQARIELGNRNPENIANYTNARMAAWQVRRQIFDQIKPILNEGQLALVLKGQQEREQRLRRVLAQLDTRIGS